MIPKNDQDYHYLMKLRKEKKLEELISYMIDWVVKRYAQDYYTRKIYCPLEFDNNKWYDFIIHEACYRGLVRL